MRAAIQLVFLVFYIGSSYVTTQHRLSFVVHKLQHSNSKGDDTALETCKERIRYTHFREAKKVGIVHFGSHTTPKFFPMVSIRHFTPQIVSLKPQREVESFPSRAPPKV